jgi:hypothetical protein
MEPNKKLKPVSKNLLCNDTWYVITSFLIYSDKVSIIRVAKFLCNNPYIQELIEHDKNVRETVKQLVSSIQKKEFTVNEGFVSFYTLHLTLKEDLIRKINKKFEIVVEALNNLKEKGMINILDLKNGNNPKLTQMFSLDGWKNLQALDLHSQSLSGELDVSKLSKLSFIDISNNKFTAIILPNNVEIVNIADNNLKRVSLKNCIKLQQLNVSDNKELEKLTIKNSKSLYILNIQGCDKLRSLNM